MPESCGAVGRRMLDVCVVLLDDGYASTALIPVEVFHSAGALWRRLRGETPEPRFRVTTASISGGPVRSPYGGLSMNPERRLADVMHADIVVVSASGGLPEPRNSALSPWLKARYVSGAYLAGVCTGAGYLAETGLLDGKRATTHWAMSSGFEERYPDVDWRPDLMVTEDSRLLCSGGVTASSDISLYLVEKLCGHEIAVHTAKALLLAMPRMHQSGYAVLPLSPVHTDDRIRAAETLIQAKFREALSTEELAGEARMSGRTFLRRFKAATGKVPAAYLQAVRIEAAKAILEREALPVQAISARVGYDDVSFFRMLFKRTTGMTPAEYRAHFAGITARLPEGVSFEA
ncbi:MAG: helix-turn-helix domain-containing protein [Hyphomonadaceae bacterium]|nr:helix-turn-helix domain-containing protein [Hyphomonadaceae bacterium]